LLAIVVDPWCLVVQAPASASEFTEEGKEKEKVDDKQKRLLG
jgi:hypothetical protein